MAKTMKTTAWLKVWDAKRGLLDSMGGTYQRAVQEVALALKPRFLSGELHGWGKADQERMEEELKAEVKANFKRKGRKWTPPLWRVEAACGRLFIRNASLAILVLEHHRARPEERFSWTRNSLPASLRQYAEVAMAGDVVAYAKRAGWLRAA